MERDKEKDIKTLMLVTGNKNKLKEMKSILGNELPYEVQNICINLKEYQGTPKEIAKWKCKDAVKLVKGPVVVEDTCLCFNALGGLPGPYIKYFLDEIGSEGLHKLLQAWEDKSAYALCTIGFADNEDDEIHILQGRVNGTIVEPRGENAFGWDSCFKPENHELTFGEMPESLKNTISHRFKAMVMLKNFLLRR